ncbi:MAG: DNA repair protein RecO [Bacteroidota bacterium]
MLHKTKAIILKATPYGDTSLVVSAYTEAFGLQSYMVKGARKQGKKNGSQAMYFQPAAILDLVVYHNELKHLQLIKEIKWSYLYNEVLSNVTKYSVALFMIELFSKCTKQTEVNTELFAFIENTLMILDQTPLTVTANLPLHFALQLAGELGFRPEDNYSNECSILDLQEGRFVNQFPVHQLYLEGKLSEITFELLQTDNPVTLYRIKLQQQTRRQLLQAYEQFFMYHISDFGYLKTVKVLEEVLG